MLDWLGLVLLLLFALQQILDLQILFQNTGVLHSTSLKGTYKRKSSA